MLRALLVSAAMSLVAGAAVPSWAANTTCRTKQKKKRKRGRKAKAAAEAAAPAEAPAAEAPKEGPPSPPGLRVSAGPVTGKLAGVAEVEVPEPYGFVDKSQMPKLNELTGNLHNPNDVGAILAKGWLIFFTWNDIGYVSDEDKDELDAEDMLESFQDGEEAANEERTRQGLDPLHIVGWQTEPYYDTKTNNLTWALQMRAGEADRMNINHEVRLLGRRGVMSANLVASPEKLEGAVVELNQILKGFRFSQGNTYAEYLEGDKLAAVGLTGLILGGGALLAAKTGLLAKLGKFIKFIVIGVIAAVGGAFKWIKARFNGEE